MSIRSILLEYKINELQSSQCHSRQRSKRSFKTDLFTTLSSSVSVLLNRSALRDDADPHAVAAFANILMISFATVSFQIIYVRISKRFSRFAFSRCYAG